MKNATADPSAAPQDDKRERERRSWERRCWERRCWERDAGSDDAGSAMLGVTMPRSLCEVSLGMTSERGSDDDNQCPQIPGSIIEPEIGNQRQMVRCDQRGARAPEVRRLEMQRWFVIAVIQAQEGQHAR